MILGELNVAALPLLGAPAEQDDDPVAMLAQIHAVARAEIERDLEPPPPTPFTFDQFPALSRASDVVIRAAATSFSRSNHCSKGLTPAASTYCLISTDGNTYVTSRAVRL